jgi:hypothetical protein
MGLVTKLASSFQSPDPVLSGSAMTNTTTSGHDATATSGSGGSSLTRSASWSGFTAAAGQIISAVLKFDVTSSGTLVGPSPSNELTIESSINGGSSWVVATQRLNFTASQGPSTVTVSLSVGQDLTQVQLREKARAVSVDPADTAIVNSTVANIKIEVVTADPQGGVMM